MSGCMGRLGRIFSKKKRGNSLPPGGTQTGKQDGNRGRSQPAAGSFQNQSMPNISDRSQENPSVLVTKSENSKSSRKEASRSNRELDFIVPAPSNFRENANSSLSNADSIESLAAKNDDIEFMNTLKEDLENELNSKKAQEPKKLRTAVLVNEMVPGSAKVQANPRPRTSQLRVAMEDARSTEAKSQLSTLRTSNELRATTSASAASTSANNTLERNQINSANDQLSYEKVLKLVETYNNEYLEKEELLNQNRSLQLLINDLHKLALEKAAKNKLENDIMMGRIQELATKDLRNETEREALVNMVISKSQEQNQLLIEQQKIMIDSLESKSKLLEQELRTLTANESNRFNNTKTNKDLVEEVELLKKLVHRLNIELSNYQSKYPSPSLLNTKTKFTGLPPDGTIPIWLVNTRYLSPLIAAYDEKINEKDEKLKLLKAKIDDLTKKFKSILDENGDLHARLDRLPSNVRFQDQNELNDYNQMRHYGQLVLEENKILHDQLELQKKNIFDSQRKHIFEIGSLSKKIMMHEAEIRDLNDKNAILKANYDMAMQKLNESVAESQRRISLNEHLNQTSDLKRKIDEINVLHKYELDNTLLLLESAQAEKKELVIKVSNLTGENQRLSAENKVMEKAINDGIGRKSQRKVNELERKLELAQMKEKTAVACYEKLLQEAEKLKIEKEAFENLAKSFELEVKKLENRIAEENLKQVKIEEKLSDYKEKSAAKLADVVQKLKNKDSEFTLIKLESQKKVSDLLILLQKKQDQIDDLIGEKRQLEAKVEATWQSTSAENRQLKELFLRINPKYEIKKTESEPYTLLFDD